MMTNDTIEDLGRKMDDLNMWGKLVPYNWAVKPRGIVIPYFCSVVFDENPSVKVRLWLLEGWQTLHDYIRTRVDHNFGFYSSPIEFPHYELVLLKTGEIKLFRHDPGYMPVEANERQRQFVRRMLWEVYGFMLRQESDEGLAMRYVADRAIFGRVETAPDVWEDSPLRIPDPPPYVENVSFSKALIKRAKDVPFVSEDVLHVDFAIQPWIMTKEPRPRCVYALVAYDPAAKAKVVDLRASVSPESGLKRLWEMMPGQLLTALVERGRIPGVIKVSSGRVFRMLRPLCLEIPFKLTLTEKLEFS